MKITPIAAIGKTENPEKICRRTVFIEHPHGTQENLRIGRKWTQSRGGCRATRINLLEESGEPGWRRALERCSKRGSLGDLAWIAITRSQNRICQRHYANKY